MDDMFNPMFLKNLEKRPPIPKDATVTMAYIPLQETTETYTEKEGLAKGTIFPQLDKPFCGKMVKKV